MAKKETIAITWDVGNQDFTPVDDHRTGYSQVGAAVVNKYTAKRLYDGKMITGYGYAYNGQTYVTESDAPPHLVNWHEVDGSTLQICAL